MDAADEVWNRAALAGGGPDPREGDIALASALSVHGLVMNGGLLNAVEVATPQQVQAAEAGFRWLGLEAAAAAVAAVRREIEAGVLDDLAAAEELELRADGEYGRVVPDDQALFDAFRARFVEEPQSFAPA